MNNKKTEDNYDLATGNKLAKLGPSRHDKSPMMNGI